MAWGDNLLDWLGVPMGTSSPSLSPSTPATGDNWDTSSGATPPDLAASSQALNIPAPSTNPSSDTGSWDTSSGSGGGSGAPASHNLAAALQKLGEGLKGPQQTQPPPAQSVHSAPQMPQSTFSRGGGGGLDNLVSSLQRRMYLPIGYQAAGSNNIRGLLGY